MNARKFPGTRLGQWIFGSAVAWGCIGPSTLGDLLRGSFSCCSTTIAVGCLGPGTCPLIYQCTCANVGTGNCDLAPSHDCLRYPGCANQTQAGKCDQSIEMSVCYY